MDRMHTGFVFAACLVFASCATIPAGGSSYASAAPSPDVVTDVGDFYDALAPYGIWVSVSPYGLCWVPEDVGPDWMPYTDGMWAYTDYGWTWVADEEWGWAPFHYGRWVDLPDYGWTWVPGTEWGPAWVAWRADDGFMGWAPLPPEAVWQPGIGFEVGFNDIDSRIEPRAWCFLADRDFGRVHGRRYYAPPDERDEIVRRSRDITNYGIVNRRIVNNSVDVKLVESKLGRPVMRYRVEDVDATRGASRIAMKGNVIEIPRPGARSGGNVRTVDRRASVPPEIMQRHAEEFRSLRQRQGRELATFEQRVQTQSNGAPSARRAEMLQRNEAERRSLMARQAQELRDLWKRHVKERQSPPRVKTQASR
jgi:hypothetical protein